MLLGHQVDDIRAAREPGAGQTCSKVDGGFDRLHHARTSPDPYLVEEGAPDAERTSVGEENFEWVVENAANMAIDYAVRQKPGQVNLTWGSFIRDAVSGTKRKS